MRTPNSAPNSEQVEIIFEFQSSSVNGAGLCELVSMLQYKRVKTLSLSQISYEYMSKVLFVEGTLKC